MSRISEIRFRSRIQLLISENLALHFNYLLTVYEQTVLQRIIIEPTSIRELEWEAMQRFAKNLIQVAYERNIVGAEKERLIRMRDTLVNKMLNITDCDVLSEMLSIHSPFLPSYADDYEKLNTYVSLLRRGLLMSSDSKTLSRHAVSLILRAVQTFPEYFKVDEVISKMQMAQLLQVLAVLSNSIDDEHVKLELLRMAAGPTIEYLHRISWSFEDVPAFIKFNAFDTARTGADDSSTMNRIELRRALTCIQGVVQQVNSSSQLGTMLIPIYPCFFKLTRCLMELHLEKNKALLHESFRDSLTNMVAAEKQQIYCKFNHPA
ncbi:unnamed protein product [Cylicostephanus goldi]|uniref:Uncharacterized protein n=1 Tax=Cylicostephanus goldi TaxID=71465 RepID=A0A3P6Q5I5_CYLGO|nr:unnamed protein product [Cylicostephanus goldi]